MGIPQRERLVQTFLKRWETRNPGARQGSLASAPIR